jgi:UDP-N-acetylglucosamine 1-carboxyvinyltransferase
VLDKLRTAGAAVAVGLDEFTVAMDAAAARGRLRHVALPGFATDLQPMAIALAAVADGTSMITENVFGARFGRQTR